MPDRSRKEHFRLWRIGRSMGGQWPYHPEHNWPHLVEIWGDPLTLQGQTQLLHGGEFLKNEQSSEEWHNIESWHPRQELHSKKKIIKNGWQISLTTVILGQGLWMQLEWTVCNKLHPGMGQLRRWTANPKIQPPGMGMIPTILGYPTKESMEIPPRTTPAFSLCDILDHCTDRVTHQKKDIAIKAGRGQGQKWRERGGGTWGHWWWEMCMSAGMCVAALYDWSLIINSFVTIFHNDSIK